MISSILLSAAILISSPHDKYEIMYDYFINADSIRITVEPGYGDLIYTWIDQTVIMGVVQGYYDHDKLYIVSVYTPHNLQNDLRFHTKNGFLPFKQAIRRLSHNKKILKIEPIRSRATMTLYSTGTTKILATE